MEDNTNKDQADWQKNSARPSNFNEKDDKLYKGENGNLRVKKEGNSLNDSEDESIQDTLNNLDEEE